MSDEAAARAEIDRRLRDEVCRYYVPNGRLDDFIQAVGQRFEPKSKRIYIAILRGGNGIGKSVLAANLASYMADDYPNLYLDQAPYLKNFRRPNRGRILTTVNAAKNNYDAEFSKWLRRGKYSRIKEGKHFYNKYRFQGGSEFDIFTFDQDPGQGESITLNWAIVDEPMSKAHWKALKFRFRFGGIIFMLLTPLEGSGWYHDEFETVERMNDDVLVMEGSSEDNCKTHGIRGMSDHITLEDQWRDCDEDELLSRRDGKYLEHAGNIYKNFRDDAKGHVLQDFPAYYQDCWDKGLYTLWQRIDPHDRKPWAISWRAFFPDGKSFCVAEWPDESMRPFHKIKSWGFGYDAYAKLTVDTEKALGVGRFSRATIMDPNYGPSAAMNKQGVTSIGAEFQKAVREAGGGHRRMIFPNDSLTPGHLLVKDKLGDPAKGVTPDYYYLAHCKNSRFGMLHYGYRENKDEKKGLSEEPVLQFKDFPDLDRYGAMAKEGYVEFVTEEAENMVHSAPKKMGNGYVRA